jgi:predicted MFS family arabinose efflux permease
MSKSSATMPADSARISRETRVIAALCVASFLASLNFFATSPFYAVMADDLDTSVPLLGQVTTGMICVSTVLGLFLGPVADRYGYRRPLVMGVIAVAVTLAGAGLSPSYPVLLAFSVSGGLADALVFGLPLAVAGVRFKGAAQRKAIGWTMGSLSSAPIVGTPLLTTAASFSSWRYALVAAGVASLLAAWFVHSALPADETPPSEPFAWREILDAYLPILGHAHTLRLYGASAFRAISWIGLLTYLGAFLSDEVGLSTRGIGFAYMAGGSGYAIASVLSARLVDVSSRRIVSISCLVSAVAIGVTMQLTSVWLVVPLLITSSIVASFVGIGIASILARESPAGTGTTMVLNGSLLNLGSAVGALVGGVFLSVGDYRTLGFGLPVFAIIAAGLAVWPSPGGSTGDGASRPIRQRV